MDLTRKTYQSKDYFALEGIEQLAGYHGNQLKTFDEFIGGLSYSRLITKTEASICGRSN